MRFLLAALMHFAHWAIAQEMPPSLRLPEGIRPLHYAAELTLRPAQGRFQGEIEIEVEVSRPASVIWLNARFLQVEHARIGAASARVLPGGREFVGIQPPVPLPPGRATLRLAYRGELSERDNVGAFRVRDGNDWYVYTQLESIFARRVFPCFDEPGYKVPWRLTLVVPAGDLAVANTPVESETALPDGMKRVRFAPTRPLPSYLIAFGVGPFDVVDAGKAGKNATPLRILTPRGQGALARYAAQVTPRILEITEEYTGLAHPYEKLDSLAVPRPGGAMENPGLITYASSLILARPRDETPRFKQAYAHVAAHEIAHLWFGDLVTHAWWDDLWLNESFATWLSDKTIERLEPAWDIRAKSVLDRDWAMKNDALATARRIRQPIESENDIYNAFDPITYAKGGAVLWMFERWIGEARFRDAIRRYLAKHADGVASTRDFLDQLSAVEPAAGEAFASFLEQAGLPIVSVEVHCSAGRARLWLAQRRYLPLGSTAGNAQVWQVPFCVRHGTAGAEQRACILLKSELAGMELGGGCPATVDVEASRYFRVEFSGDLARRAGEPGGANARDAAIVGDLDALSRAGVRRLDEILPQLQDYATRRSRDVVQGVIWALAGLRPLVADELRPAWERFIARAFSPWARELGLAARPRDDDDLLRLRPAVLDILTADGHDAALMDEAKQLALRWLADRSAVDGTMSEAVLQAAARRGDRTLFDRLVAAIPGADRRERRSIYVALGSFGDGDLARAALALMLDPAQDFRESSQIAWTLSNTPRGSALVHAFAKANFAALEARAPRDAPASWPRWAGGLCDESGRADVEAFYRERAPRYAGGPRILAQTLERIALCSAFKNRQQANLSSFLRDR